MNQPGTVCLLEDLGVLHIAGAEAGKFLQGQLSNDVSVLSAGTLLRAGLHNPQGRALALLALIDAADEGILAVLPVELMATVAAHLRRYVLRSKVTISDDSGKYRVLGLAGRDAGAALTGLRVAYGLSSDERALLLQPVSAPAPGADAMPRDAWRALDVAAGLPQVYGATSGQFVAQMLNLDCINAISFTKGCYTGQEVIARAHYRGRIKRRMQRFLSAAPLRLAAGDPGVLSDGRSYRVVEATQHADGRCEFLAVAALAAATEGVAAEGLGGAVGDADQSGRPAGAGAEGVSVAATALPLPYLLPD
jgi:folate-binding protein YgfZ